MNDIFGHVTEIMGDLFGVDPASITLDSSKDTVEGWDSLQQVNLVLDIEQRFETHFESDEIARLKTVRDIVRLLEAKQLGSTVGDREWAESTGLPSGDGRPTELPWPGRQFRSSTHGPK